MPAFEAVRRWRGLAVLDNDGNKIGSIVEIYYDSETDEPGWALLSTAGIAGDTCLVPLRDAAEQGNEIRVPYDQLQVRGAPGMEPGGRLWPQDEAALYAYYALPYSGGLDDLDDEEDIGGTVTVGPSSRWHFGS
ncbi:MAG TPA: PRC-barrel domain-containing protein [Actinomycetota bacterium]